MGERRSSNSGGGSGGAPAMVVAGLLGLRLGEVQRGKGNLFRGSIGAEGRWVGVLHGAWPAAVMAIRHGGGVHGTRKGVAPFIGTREGEEKKL